MSRTRTAAEAWGAVLRVQAELVPRMDRELQDRAGLPLRWYDVLLELSAAPDRRLTMGQLGERVVLSRTRVSRVVDELEEAGLVRRDANADDRRSAFAALTEQGRAAFSRAAPVYRRAIATLFAAALTDDELVVIRDGLDRARARLSDPPG